MNLYLIERDDNASYDEYVSAIVCAESEELKFKEKLYRLYGEGEQSERN